MPTTPMGPEQLATLAAQIRDWGAALGFGKIGISDTALEEAGARLQRWLDRGCHGTMDYMASHGARRWRPAELVPGTQRIVSVRMDYLPEPMTAMQAALDDPARAYVSRYALGRDYHKLLRARLQQLADRLTQSIGPFGYRVFCDSAPVMEKDIAARAGLGWIGKHTNVIDRHAGSWFFLGELYTDLPLPVDAPVNAHCGSCTACLDICPTRAIIEPYVVDARLCISYLTIEHHGAIPEPLRPLLGNRIYGCDDCQLVCPWNRYAQLTRETDFAPRHRLDHATLIELFQWDEAAFLKKTEGSAIRRIGHEHWLRNIAVALGNAPHSDAIIAALHGRAAHPSALVREHVAWALRRHGVA